MLILCVLVSRSRLLALRIPRIVDQVIQEIPTRSPVVYVGYRVLSEDTPYVCGMLRGCLRMLGCLKCVL